MTDTLPLYQRLGGAKGISNIVDDIYFLHKTNPVVKARFANSNEEHVKARLREIFAATTGAVIDGTTVEYNGKDMRTAHSGGVVSPLTREVLLYSFKSMNISEDEFEAAVADVKQALAKNAVEKQEQGEVVDILNAAKKDVLEGSAEPKGSTSTPSVIPYYLSYLPSLIAFAGLYYQGIWVWGVVFFTFVIAPLGDLLVGVDYYNPTPAEHKRMKTALKYRVVTWLYTPVYATLVGYSLYVIGSGQLSPVEIVGHTLSMGVLGGLGIGCVHELIHRPHSLDLGLGITALILQCYGHFWIEHLWGHHKRVATPLDPATSLLGSNLYTFLPKCIWRSLVDSIKIEAAIIRKHNHSPYNPLYNRIIQAHLASAVLAAFVYSYLGVPGLFFFLGQGVLASIVLETVNYIEHYGLLRRLEQGKETSTAESKYERVGWWHAWNTGDRISNLLLFKIQRHPDHHTNAGRPYQTLRTYNEAPTMPTGYPGMIVLSLFPPLYWAVMNPRVAYVELQRRVFEEKGYNPFPNESRAIHSVFNKVDESFHEHTPIVVETQ